jgi:glycosyltransferase involved in cell wall biosynthesis
MLLSVLSLLILGIWVHICVRNARAVAGLGDLPEPLPSHDSASLPRLSVIVAARNEEEAIGECLDRLMAQDLPDLEVVVVNDRSTDRTAEIINAAAAHEAAAHQPLRHRITPIHLTDQDLPPGWLGKCNALSRGAKAASGDWLLFLDGDILLAPQALRHAVAHAQGQGAGMLALLPSMLPGSALEQSLMLVFSMGFLYKFNPAHAMDPDKPDYIGVGAFNMVRRDAYDAIGGHEKLRLMIIDDVALGGFVKRAGYRLAVASGSDLVRVRWYPSVWSMVVGLEKNAFAGVNYSLPKAIGACVAIGLMYLVPLFLLVLAPWPVGLFALPSVLLLPLIGWVAGRRQSFGGVLPGLLLPVGGLLFIITMMRSAIVTLRQGGVKWRDSFYPLSELRQFTLPD